MSLLRVITEQAVDPDYARAAKEPRRPRAWMSMLLVMVLVGGLFSMAIVQTTRTRPLIAAEREELIRHIKDARNRQEDMTAAVQATDAEVRRLQNEAIDQNQDAAQYREDLDRLEPLAGGGAVTGPGLIITVDDAPGAQSNQRVVDRDLQHLVNGLWASGAEAIAINGHRLSSLTAIRGAGESITVDYRSLTRPYIIEVIGNPDTLPADFAESSGGRWWAHVTQLFGLRFHQQVADHLELPADPGQELRHTTRRATG